MEQIEQLQQTKPQSKLWLVLSVIQKIALVIIVAFIIRSFIIQPFIIEGRSMEPSYHNNQFILIDKISYRLHKPNKGDVVVFQNPKNPSIYFIKRIIGLPGDDVKIEGGNVYINNQIISEPYLAPGQKTTVDSLENKYDVIVPGNEYFVMGDNRDESSDSREWNFLPKMNIVGKLWVVVYPIGFIQNSSYAAPKLFR